MRKLAPGTIFGRDYEILRCISTGGMGAVYEASHRPTRRRRALKVMLPTLLVDDDARSRFALEAVVTAGISSEHIVEVLDAGIDEATESPFLAMELLSGEDLGVRTRRLGRLGAGEVVELLSQAARGLEKTHAGGVVHRDLKPENLFRTERDDGSPKVKILDFGIAKLVVSSTGRPTTRAIGTPLYMAPEQLESVAKKIGPAVDVYALAQIAFTLLVGTPYFHDEAESSNHVFGVLGAVSRGTKEAAGARAKRRGVELPAGFDAWFAQATALDPAARFDGARLAVEELARAVQVPRSALDGASEPPPKSPPVHSFTHAKTLDAGTSDSVADGQSVRPAVGKTGANRGRRPLSWMGAAVVAAALVVAAIMGIRSASGPESTNVGSPAPSPPLLSSSSATLPLPMPSDPSPKVAPASTGSEAPESTAPVVAPSATVESRSSPVRSASKPDRKLPVKTPPGPTAPSAEPPLLPWEQRNPVRP